MSGGGVRYKVYTEGGSHCTLVVKSPLPFPCTYTCSLQCTGYMRERVGPYTSESKSLPPFLSHVFLNKVCTGGRTEMS